MHDGRCKATLSQQKGVYARLRRAMRERERTELAATTRPHQPMFFFRNANTLSQPSAACSGRYATRAQLKKAWPQPS